MEDLKLFALHGRGFNPFTILIISKFTFFCARNFAVSRRNAIKPHSTPAILSAINIDVCKEVSGNELNWNFVTS